MSINNINNANKPQVDAQKLGQQQAQNNAAAPAKANAAAKAAVSSDSVSLTQSAQQLANVQRKGSEAPINQDKVDRLKKAIAEGEYKVNPEALAKKIAVLEAQILGVRN